MSFTCFVPGHPIVPAAAFQQASEDRWCVDLHAETPINDLAAFVSTPLEPGTALSCFIACAPFEATSWHYLGAISNECPSCLFKLRYVWSARDAMPTHVQFGVQLVQQAQLHASPPAEKVSAEVLDIVGTGGDRFGTVNVSTMASVVAAATGIPVVKHGNRAASSASGSSDVLGALGVELTLDPAAVTDTLERAGITFVFASAFHPGFRHAGAVRKELGVPTVFNFLGPLSNPARAEANAVGVASLERVPLITGVFRNRGATALVFRGDGS